MLDAGSKSTSVLGLRLLQSYVPLRTDRSVSCRKEGPTKWEDSLRPACTSVHYPKHVVRLACLHQVYIFEAER